FVYQSTIRVPLLLRGPGIPAGTRPAVTARGVDLAPTVLDLLAVAPPPGMRPSGRSLAGALRGAETPREEAAYAESLLPLLHYGWSDLRTLREGRWKYIQAPRPELYDLQEDPGELRDLAAAQPARAEAFRAALARRLEAEREAGPRTADAMPPDLLEKLGAMGYLGAGAPSEAAATGADPKDKIEEFKVLNRLVREGLLSLREKDYAGSARSFEELRRRGVSSFEVHYYLARALVGLRRPREAAPHFEEAIRRLPGFSAAYLALADCRIALSDLPRALEALERGRDRAPKDPRLPEREGQVLRKMGRLEDAVRAYEAAAALAPKDALLRIQLGEVHRDRGDLARAAALMREAVDLDPGPASFWNSLGMVRGAARDLPAAEAAFREALARDEGNAQYAYNLGLALSRQGRREEAAALFRRALALRPDFPAPRERLAELGR
ncbi:MAG TPA: tetratricopeptide repeat protein, partial [Vicinamibacteria bacterium]|nr:tetratricopeptide repeat protein [Vicinamibacteria bacterium]